MLGARRWLPVPSSWKTEIDASGLAPTVFLLIGDFVSVFILSLLRRGEMADHAFLEGVSL